MVLLVVVVLLVLGDGSCAMVDAGGSVLAPDNRAAMALALDKASSAGVLMVESSRMLE